MIVPLTHERMTVRRLPWVTLAILAVNLIVFLVTWPRAKSEQERLMEVVRELQELAQAHPGMASEHFEDSGSLARYKELAARFEEINSQRVYTRLGFVPSRQEWPDLVSSMFLHGGWLHLLGNMYLLWLCGCSLEDIWGRPTYLGLYLTAGVAAALAHAWAFPESPAPLVGASGAIAGLMGAFLVRLARTRIRMFYWFGIFYGNFNAPAGLILPLWVLTQIFYAMVYQDASPVAFWAHVGGFAFGVAAGLLIKLSRVEEAFLSPAIDQKTTLFSQHPQVAAALARMDARDYGQAAVALSGALRDNPEDVDALHLLGECYAELGRPANALQALERKLQVHLRRREKDLAVDTFADMKSISPNVRLSPRLELSLGVALADTNHYADAITLYRELIDSETEPLHKLKAGVALAELYQKENDVQRALATLRTVEPFAQALPDWKLLLEERMSSLRRDRPS